MSFIFTLCIYHAAKSFILTFLRLLDYQMVFYAAQCDQMVILFVNIWQFTIMKICAIAKCLTKFGWKCFLTLSKPLKSLPRLLKFSQSGEISPNLVTLTPQQNSYHIHPSQDCRLQMEKWRSFFHFLFLESLLSANLRRLLSCLSNFSDVDLIFNVVVAVDVVCWASFLSSFDVPSSPHLLFPSS